MIAQAKPIQVESADTIGSVMRYSGSGQPSLLRKTGRTEGTDQRYPHEGEEVLLLQFGSRHVPLPSLPSQSLRPPGEQDVSPSLAEDESVQDTREGSKNALYLKDSKPRPVLTTFTSTDAITPLDTPILPDPTHQDASKRLYDAISTVGIKWCAVLT